MAHRPTLRSSIRLLTLLCAVGASAPTGAAQVPPRLRVDAGQALALGPDGVRRVFAGEGEAELADVHGLEVPPGSRASLRWPGRASVGLEGPAGLSFAGTGEAGPTRWSLWGRGAFELEVRRGRVRTELAPGWSAVLEGGAWRLVGLPDGSARIAHRAGAPLLLVWGGPRGALLPPVELRAGDELRLGPAAPTALRTETGRPTRAWAGVGSWPFGPSGGQALSGAVDPPRRGSSRQRGGVGVGRAAPGGEGPLAWPWALAPQDPEGVPLERLSDPAAPADSVAPPAAGAPAGSTRADPSPGVLPGGEPSEVPAPPSANDALPWRGLPSERLASAGSLRHEPSPFLRVETRSDGGAWLLLDPAAPRGVWVFAPRRDYRLAPGAAIRLDSAGELRARAGRVTALPAGPRP